jgi:hypothetical protein
LDEHTSFIQRLNFACGTAKDFAENDEFVENQEWKWCDGLNPKKENNKIDTPCY